MSQRFFVASPLTGDTALLDGPEAHHLLHVMRARVGERVVVFDGSGVECDAEVARLGRHDAALRVLARREVDRECRRAITLGVALPKGERQRWLVEKLVELGVARLIPLHTEHGVAEAGAGALERLRRGVIEASKQCGRNRLMQVDAPLDWPVFLQVDAAADTRWVADPSGVSVDEAAPKAPAGIVSAASANAFVAAIGPEGGFTPGELELARRANWKVVGLGPRLLRVETAAILIAARWADLAGGRQ